MDSTITTASSILAVDHDVATRKLCRELLEPENVAILEAADLPKSLSRIAERRPRLIIVNVAMSHGKGLECVRLVKGDLAH
ncbi:MAG: response regulator [Planctomycetes bacterium]|nr:response regulator [Planctomycetota bacterium]